PRGTSRQSRRARSVLWRPSGTGFGPPTRQGFRVAPLTRHTWFRFLLVSLRNAWFKNRMWYVVGSMWGRTLPILNLELLYSRSPLPTAACVLPTGSLSYHQLTPARLLEFHGGLDGFDGGFQLAVVGLARGDTLQPQPGLRCPAPEPSLRFCRKADAFVGDAGDHRQEREPAHESHSEGAKGQEHVEDHGDGHHHQ